MRRIYPHRLDASYSIIIGECSDGPDYVWTLTCDGGDFLEGYEATEEEAFQKALDAYNDHMAWLETGAQS